MEAPNTAHRKPDPPGNFVSLALLKFAIKETQFMLHGFMYNGHERFLCNVQVREYCASQRVQQDLQEGLDRCNDRHLLGD
jgi:hypothetical protein